jgi:hypothetical protein
MAQRAYTDLDPRAQEVLAINQLYKSVSPDVKYQCTNQNCKTVSDAVEVIERYEVIVESGCCSTLCQLSCGDGLFVSSSDNLLVSVCKVS